MTEYKEIQDQTYLNLDNGEVYFAIEEVLRIINCKTEANDANTISPIRLNRVMKQHNIEWTTISRSQVKLLTFFHDPTPNDEHTASLDKINVINSIKMVKLINIIRSMHPTKNSSQKFYKFIEQEWGAT